MPGPVVLVQSVFGWKLSAADITDQLVTITALLFVFCQLKLGLESEIVNSN